MYFINLFNNMIKILKSKSVPIVDKIPIILMIAYIISPIDLIPFPILGFSVLDDMVIFLILANLVKKTISKYVNMNEQATDPEHIVSNVKYEVKDDPVKDEDMDKDTDKHEK